MTHELKILPKYFDDVKNHIKNFEVRINDREYKVGDTLILKEYYLGKYTGREYSTKIIYVFDNPYMLIDNYVILGMEICERNQTKCCY